jgi:hypothetical protein
MFLVALATWVGAQSGTKPSPAEQAQLLHRNRELIAAAVENGLLLTAQHDPLDRAENCTDLARRLAGAVEQAARADEPSRAAELGQHLRLVVDSGVTANLTQARHLIAVGSAAEQKLIDRRDQAVRVIDDLLRHLTGTNANLDPVIADLRKGRDQLQKAAEKAK